MPVIFASALPGPAPENFRE